VLADSDPGGVPEVEAPLVRGEFALQFGAFHDRRLALRLAGQLSGSVTDLRLERDLAASPAWYRVVGGRYTTRSGADAALASLADQGVQAVVLRPGRGG
jgi:cell division protein FtsN